ncbi:conserved hypothetical protein [Rhodobacteraceae bacterium KLH11]|nr:conserved hypothetical protein [Rhodobacteraceae bacterium KLH11]
MNTDKSQPIKRLLRLREIIEPEGPIPVRKSTWWVRYKLAFDRYVEERGYNGIKSLVAFSGAVDDPVIPESAYTEVGMNNGCLTSAPLGRNSGI